MGKHRPKPGDPGWSHPHVKGETDPAKVKAKLDAIEDQERREKHRVSQERLRRGK